MIKLLQRVYNDPSSPAYLAGQQAVFREARKLNPAVRLRDVVDFLTTQEHYTLHKPIRHKYARNRVVAAGIDSDWQLDLIDLRNLPHANRKHKFILACIDVFSKYGWAIPMATKQPAETLKAFRVILRDKRKPWRICHDRGTEFAGVFKQFLAEQSIVQFFATSPDVKASVVERYIRTLKTRLWRHFSKNKTLNWIDAIGDIAAAYNRSVHRSIGVAPVDVTIANEREVRHYLYGTDPGPAVKFNYKVGESVRITREKGKLSKGYQPTFTGEIFHISKRLNRFPATYRIEDANGEAIDGIFYESEFSRVRPEELAGKVYKRDKRKRR